MFFFFLNAPGRTRLDHFAVKALKIISLEGGRVHAALKITVDQVLGGTDVFFHARSSRSHINALEKSTGNVSNLRKTTLRSGPAHPAL